MNALLWAEGILMLAALLALVAGRSNQLATRIGAGGAVLGCGLGLVGTGPVVFGAPAEFVRRPWDVPYGAFSMELDALSGFFLLPILLLSALAAIYGAAYLEPRKASRPLGLHWFFFNLLVASMVMVVLARNAVLFLVAWELMALTSFFLVSFEHERAEVRAAGWTYLVASHLGTAFLLALFVLLGRGAGTLDFDSFTASAASGSALFLLAVIGFGTKAGFVPLHVWLPEAHPAAPTHVSALMSGAMIKLGIYGLVRTLTFLPSPPAWWGWLLIGIGMVSGVLGVLFALAQHDLKRLLAYHSVENIGIIALGLGVGLLGLNRQSLTLTVLGFGGGLLHVLNHALFKGLLFFGAGAVLHGTGSREIEHLGGLMKRMPWTATTFLVGSVAISGLPPLNGFVSEFLIYVGAFSGAVTLSAGDVVPLLGVVAALALIGGLAAACFAKAFGIVFLGEARSEHAVHAHEAAWPMRLPMVILAAACGLIGLGAPAAMALLGSPLAVLSGEPLGAIRPELSDWGLRLMLVGFAGLAFFTLVALLALVRIRLLRKRTVTETVTWDCGYAKPTARMQYTASSFAQPLTGLFAPLLRTRTAGSVPTQSLPTRASWATSTPDPAREAVYAPLFAAVARGLGHLRWFQHGRIQFYVLYIALTLLVLLVWKLR